MSITDQLAELVAGIGNLRAEAALVLGAIAILVFGLIPSLRRFIRLLYALTLFIATFSMLGTGLTEGPSMSNALFIGASAPSFTILFLFGGLALLIFPGDQKHGPEFYFLILNMLLGALLVIKSNSSLVLYLSVELLSFTGYILANFSFKKDAFEAGIKYLLFGAIASAFMLLGLGVLYGVSGSIYLTDWAILPVHGLSQMGLLFFLLGLFFKVSLFPAHIWVPATYQTAPPAAVAFMATVPKLAVFLVLGRVIQVIHLPMDSLLFVLLLLAGIATVVVGTLGAFKQTHVRRMVSFGAIAHSGFLLPFVLLDSDSAREAFWFYSVIYTLMNLAIFYLISKAEELNIYDLKGYQQLQNQWVLGVAFTAVVVSLVGLPPLAGFTAKLLLFTTIWEAFTVTGYSLWLVYLLVVVFASIGSLFFYMKIPQYIFLKESPKESFALPFSTKGIATLFAIMLFIFFCIPGWVYRLQQLLNHYYE